MHFFFIQPLDFNHFTGRTPTGRYTDMLFRQPQRLGEQLFDSPIRLAPID